jgi:hypothetical protein
MAYDNGLAPITFVSELCQNSVLNDGFGSGCSRDQQRQMDRTVEKKGKKGLLTFACSRTKSTSFSYIILANEKKTIFLPLQNTDLHLMKQVPASDFAAICPG